MLKDAEALFAECKDTYIALVKKVELYTSVVYKELERHVEDKRKKTGNRDEDLRRVHEKQKSVALHRFEEKLKNITGGSSKSWIKSLGEDIEREYSKTQTVLLKNDEKLSEMKSELLACKELFVTKAKRALRAKHVRYDSANLEDLYTMVVQKGLVPAKAVFIPIKHSEGYRGITTLELSKLREEQESHASENLRRWISSFPGRFPTSWVEEVDQHIEVIISHRMCLKKALEKTRLKKAK
ncbi:unnamed protein product [Enterobius vermicularis]|uniref:DUF4201 domain-containing protein n=1 Tax=Enterobius vermicularis TaxID=51028 RepID=A0A0N4UTR3_ENTVE|nr:unnamed protein product [Enterobius vermicularis]